MKLLKRKNKNIKPRRNIVDQRPMFSYYARPQTANQSPGESRDALVNRQNRYAWWQQLPTYLALLIFGVSLIYILSLDANVKVAQFINPAETRYLRDITVYQAAANAAFHQSILNRNKLTADTIQISKDLKGQFPELAEVAITLPLFGRKPVLEVIPATPVLLVNARNGAFALDKTGRALVSANEAPGLSAYSLPKVNDDAGVAIEPGKAALPEDNVKFIVAIIGQLAAKELAVEAMTLPAIVNELHVKLENTPYFIKFNTEGDAKVQVGTYLALRERLANEDKTPKEYVDVRVEERAYYK